MAAVADGAGAMVVDDVGINGDDHLAEDLADPLPGGGEPLGPILPGIPILSVADITSRAMTVLGLRDHLSARAVVCERGRPKKYYVDLLLEFEGRRREQLNPEDAAAAALEVERLRIAGEVERERVIRLRVAREQLAAAAEVEQVRLDGEARAAALALRARGGAHYDLAARFVNHSVFEYNAELGQMLLDDTLGVESGFHVYESKGLGVYLHLLPFDQIRPQYGVVFMQGLDWSSGEFKCVYSVDRVRQLEDRIEIDLLLWLTLSDDEDIPRITVSSTDVLWSLYVLTGEGIKNLQSFVLDVGDEMVRVELKPASVEVVGLQKRSVAVTSGAGQFTIINTKDAERQAAKTYMKRIVGVVSSGNVRIMDLVEQAATRGAVTEKLAPPALIARLALEVELQHSGIPAAKGQLLWYTLLGRHSDMMVESSGACESVSLDRYSEDASANMDSASGMANCWDSYIRFARKLAGPAAVNQFHFLQMVAHDFISNLRNTSSEKGALANLPLGYLKEMNSKIWLNLGLLFEDRARMAEEEQLEVPFVDALRTVFWVDTSDLEGEIARWSRNSFKRKREEKDAASAKLAADTSKKLTGGGGGRGGGRGVVGGRGGRGHGQAKPFNGGRGGAVVPAAGVRGNGGACIAHLQHLIDGTADCARVPCGFVHAPVNQIDRAAAKVTAARVITHKGRLDAFMLKLNDLTIKFLNE